MFKQQALQNLVFCLLPFSWYVDSYYFYRIPFSRYSELPILKTNFLNLSYLVGKLSITPL